MIENCAELIVPDPADVGRRATEIGEIGNGVGNRATGHFGCRAHHRVDFVSALLVDQCHRASHDADLIEEIILNVGEDIDDRVADTE